MWVHGGSVCVCSKVSSASLCGFIGASVCVCVARLAVLLYVGS